MNFQSWLDPFIIISALPAALAGIAWFLFISGTTVSVPALTGTIMCMGVATANSILVVSFAREQMQEGKDAIAAALAAGYSRYAWGASFFAALLMMGGCEVGPRYARPSVPAPPAYKELPPDWTTAQPSEPSRAESGGRFFKIRR